MPIVNRLLIALIVWELAVFLTLPARAQPTQEHTAQVQALFARTNAEINANLICSTQAIELSKLLKDEQEKVKLLLNKYEPAKADKPAETEKKD